MEDETILVPADDNSVDVPADATVVVAPPQDNSIQVKARA